MDCENFVFHRILLNEQLYYTLLEYLLQSLNMKTHLNNCCDQICADLFLKSFYNLTDAGNEQTGILPVK